MTWFQEHLHDGVSQSIRIDRLIFEGETKFQKIQIFENATLGRVLALDGIIQTTEADEFMYHEMLAHVPLFGHGSAERVLIIGGGDGGLLEEVLKHPVRKVVMVEIDGMVVDLCRQHLRSISGAAFDDPRTNLIIGDGLEFVAKGNENFDVILVDSTDPDGPGKPLFERSFYENCKARLGDWGVIATQNGVPFFQHAELSETAGNLRSIYEYSGFYGVPVPTYAGGFMTRAWASRGTDLKSADDLEVRVRNLGLKLGYYTADIHRAAFALPGYIKSLESKKQTSRGR